MESRGGLLLRFEGGAEASMLGFVPAAVATRVAALGAVVAVPGVPPPVLGIALAEGAVVTVLRLGERDAAPVSAELDEGWPVPGARRAVICRVGAVDLALTGGAVVHAGVFDAAPEGEGILWRGQMVPVLDVGAMYQQAESALWAGRAQSGRPRAGSSQSAEVEAAPLDALEDDGRPAWLPGILGDDEAGRGTR